MGIKLNKTITLFVEESCGIKRVNEPITIGIPFPEGFVFNERNIFLLDEKGVVIDLQTQILDYWFDRSIKWLLLDFQATIGANSKLEYKVLVDRDSTREEPRKSIMLRKNPHSVTIDTGITKFSLDTNFLRPFNKVIVDGLNIIEPKESKIVLTDTKGQQFLPKIKDILIETEGPLRATIKVVGSFLTARGKSFANYMARLTFFVDKSFIKCDFTIHNPRAAKHPGGLWDLGDKGSIFFKDLSFFIGLDAVKDLCITEWKSDGEDILKKSSQPIRIYQDSSGGSNWKSSNHVNRLGRVMNSFCGYRVYEDTDVIKEGERAQPIVGIASGEKRVCCGIREFWQKFPKAIETNRNTIAMRLFPKYYQDIFELQGGEQKTHTIYINYGTAQLSSIDLEWIIRPLRPKLEPQWCSDSKAFGYLTPLGQDINPRYVNLITCAIEGDDTFFHKRERVDEYGWRNFGCLYADHEAVRNKREAPLVSHYNNQYDALQGLILHHARSGDFRWWALLEPLACHTVDIDTYHTQQDKSAYNGGLFWHTEHYTDANRSTHRTYSRSSLKSKPAKYCGGGPANEHNYTTGLLYMYFLTGNLFFKEAVIGLADWVINMDDGSKTIFRFLDRNPTGLASRTASDNYNGPGRGGGNSINALIDAHILTKDEKYLLKAEELIRRCVHPQADIEAQRLRDPEYRWSYLVFLQVLGRYLDYKNELNEKDFMYHYAKESLLHYTRWMCENEVPYKSVKDKVLIWTETWPAHDMRKSNVFDFAAKYSKEPQRSKFLEKAEYFYNSCIDDLLTFETRTLLRPVVILMNYGLMHGYLFKHINEFLPKDNNTYDFGIHKRFVSQKVRVKKRLLGIFTIMGLVITVLMVQIIFLLF